MQISPEEAAYTAGIIDGEGYLFISSQKYKNTVYYKPGCIVANTNPLLMQWLRNRYGGSVTLKNKAKGNERACWGWALNSDPLQEMLRGIIPYLIIKKDEARLLLAAVELHSASRSKRDRPEAHLILLQNARDELQLLKRQTFRENYFLAASK